MSLARSRRDGMVTLVAPIRSARRASKPSGSALLDVAISRTSTELEPLQPTGRTSPVASTRSSVAWVSAGSSPISSSSKVPPSAWTMHPTFSANAPGKAPATWPNKVLSMMLAATALQSTWTIGPRARSEAAWMARAKVSLPVPGSPMIRIGRRLRAALAATARAVRKSGEAPTSSSSASSGASFSDKGASSPAARRRSRWALKRFQQPFRGDRLGEEIAGAGAHGVDRLVDRPAVGQHDDRQLRPHRAHGGDQARPGLGVPARQQGGAHFAAVRTLQQAGGGFGASGADDAPAGARRRRRDHPPLGGVGIDQQ